MSGNQQKTPFGQSLRNFGRRVTDDATQVLAKTLPASVMKMAGAIATVKYEVTGKQTLPNGTMPTLGSKYIRLPIQPGELGVTLSGDCYMGGMSGLGGGTADLSQKGNLSTNIWAPVGHTDWEAVNPDQLTLIGGPAGIHLKDATGASVITITDASISMSSHGHTLVIDASGVVIDGRIFLLHVHKDTQPGGGLSGPTN